MSWVTHDELELSADALAALLANEIPAIRIQGFASAAECDAFSAAVAASEHMRDYTTVKPGAAGYIGVSQIEARQAPGGKPGYFARIPDQLAALEALQAESFDALERFMETLAECAPAGVGIAHEPGHGDYFPCIVRRASGGLHRHYDYAGDNSPDWAIGAVDAQITWNLYTQSTAAGGETEVFNQPGRAAERGDARARKGIPLDDLAPDAESVVFAPTAGDIVLFNSRNPHEVRAGHGADGRARIAIGSFVGRLPGGRLVLWG
jgi:hypothetical protein